MSKRNNAVSHIALDYEARQRIVWLYDQAAIILDKKRVSCTPNERRLAGEVRRRIGRIFAKSEDMNSGYAVVRDKPVTMYRVNKDLLFVLSVMYNVRFIWPAYCVENLHEAVL